MRITADHTLTSPLPAVTLVVRNLHEPFRQGPRFTDFRQARQKLGAGRLKNIRCFLWRQSVFHWNRVDQSLVLLDEQRPGFFASSQALLDQKRVIPNDTLSFSGF